MQGMYKQEETRVLASTPSVSRVALLSVHTCPLDQPGTGDSGGMNVYVRSVARWLAEMGVEVDVFSRASEPTGAGRVSRIREMDPGVRVIHLAAGPDRPVAKDELQEHLCEFLYSLLRFESIEAARLGVPRAYDAVHSNYWLSGWVGRLAAERWGVPLLHSFHTLGRVKNRSLVAGEAPESAARIAAEERIVHTADCILAPTVDEAQDLITLYGAPADRVRVVSPGVDTEVFRPDPVAGRAMRERLGFAGRTVILFAGRLQLLKSPDLAVRTLADLVRTEPQLDPVMLMLGGPSGNAGLAPEAIEKLAADLGVADRLVLHPPVPHRELPDYYRAADVVLVPSRSESFGLVALEAAACGIPVVATETGGLRTAVRHGSTGLLVPGASPRAFAGAIAQICTDPARARTFGEAGAHYARRFDWRQAAAGLLSAYEQQAAAVDSRG